MNKDELQKYCEGSDNLFLVHGTSQHFADLILEEGLRVRRNNNATVLWAEQGQVNGGRLVDYTWQETDGVVANIIFGIPQQIIENFAKHNIPLNQITLFEVLNKFIDVPVPDTPEQWKKYNNHLENEKILVHLGHLLESVLT